VTMRFARAAGGSRRRAAASAAGLAFVLVALSATPAAAAAPVALPSAAVSPSQVQAQQWWLDKLNVRKAWTISKGAGVTVAVLDGGVDASFGDLRGAVVPGFVPGGSGDGRKDTDASYHGTLMADDIAGRGTGFGLLGIAPEAKIMPVVVPNDNNIEATTILALDHLSAMAHPPQVVNMSYGWEAPCSAEMQQSVARATAKGTILVASAGNKGEQGNPPSAPASCPGVVAVGAVDQSIQPWSGSTRAGYVALAAPGVHIIGYDTSASTHYGYADGTSDSAAIVSGMFALLRSHFPKASSRDLVTRALYLTYSLDGSKHKRNPEVGFGVALPYDALTRSVPAGAANPVYDAIKTAPTSTPPTPDTSTSNATSNAGTTPPGTRSSAPLGADTSSSGSNTGLIIGIVVAVVVVGALLILLLVRNRRPARR
jgi:subtilisin family serine protease